MIDAEVLLYIAKLTKYLETNKNAREHFVSNLDVEIFMENVTMVAMKNFLKKNDPTLTMDQFEQIRESMRSELNKDILEEIDEISNRDDSYYEPTIFIDERGLETIKTK
jgi:DNA-binding MltR family transcriptional regulator|tara:strand:- start:486 stop:812 length:327 start_codon:yes stop_codon:yes gene_type:complete